MSDDMVSECYRIAMNTAKSWEDALKFSHEYEGDGDLYEIEDSIEHMFDNDVLDIRVNCFLSDTETFRHAELCVGWGGPNVYLNCGDCVVEVYWGFDRSEYPLSYEVCNYINDRVEEMWRYTSKE